MSISHGERVAVAADKRFEELPLSPEDFFILSRISGETTISDVISASGLDGSVVEAILERLLACGALHVVATTPSQTPRAGESSATRMRVAMERSRVSVPERAAESTTRGRVPRPEAKVAADSGSWGQNVSVPLVAPNDARLDTALPIATDEQRRLLALFDRHDELTHYEILGIAPTVDGKVIRRGYFSASRRFHPDTYYGKDIRRFEPILDALFRRAKQAYAELTDPVRGPAYAQPWINAQRAHEEERLRAQQWAEKQQQDLDVQREQERKQRDQQRQRARMERVTTELKDKARGHFEEGRRAMEAGQIAAAANFFRLALQFDPGEPEYTELWQRCLGLARRERAAKAFERALVLAQIGHAAEAAHFFLEAAEANPTAMHLASAADAVRETDVPRARQLALKALDALNAAEAMGQRASASDAARIHVCTARAFLAAGQKRSAEDQAQLAYKFAPADPQVRALLNSLKLP